LIGSDGKPFESHDIENFPSYEICSKDILVLSCLVSYDVTLQMSIKKRDDGTGADPGYFKEGGAGVDWALLSSFHCMSICKTGE
jgi:hypothetical protein